MGKEGQREAADDMLSLCRRWGESLRKTNWSSTPLGEHPTREYCVQRWQCNGHALKKLEQENQDYSESQFELLKMAV